MPLTRNEQIQILDAAHKQVLADLHATPTATMNATPAERARVNGRRDHLARISSGLGTMLDELIRKPACYVCSGTGRVPSLPGEIHLDTGHVDDEARCPECLGEGA